MDLLGQLIRRLLLLKPNRNPRHLEMYHNMMAMGQIRIVIPVNIRFNPHSAPTPKWDPLVLTTTAIWLCVCVCLLLAVPLKPTGGYPQAKASEKDMAWFQKTPGPLSGLDWWELGFEPMVLVEGTTVSPQSLPLAATSVRRREKLPNASA